MVETAANLKIHLFGAPSFMINGQPLAGSTSHKVDALFAYLVCHPYPHLREALASLLFNSQSRNHANNNLRVLLSRLRRVCEDTILINRQTVRLNPAYEVWLDTAVFQQTIPQQPERALKLYRGRMGRARTRTTSPDGLGNTFAGHQQIRKARSNRKGNHFCRAACCH